MQYIWRHTEIARFSLGRYPNIGFGILGSINLCIVGIEMCDLGKKDKFISCHSGEFIQDGYEGRKRNCQLALEDHWDLGVSE